MPHEVPANELEYEVSCSVISFGNKIKALTPVSFMVLLQPADPESWFINTAADSVVSGDEEDFARVVRGMLSLIYSYSSRCIRNICRR